MRPLVVVFLGALSPIWSAAAAQQHGSAGDETAVRALVDAYVEARERRDPAAIGALFTADADQFNTAGQWRRGRDAIVRGTLESSRRNSGTRSITIRAIRFPSPDVAVADGDYEIASVAGGTPRRMWTTIVAAHQSDGWRITAIRNSLPTSTPTVSTGPEPDAEAR